MSVCHLFSSSNTAFESMPAYRSEDTVCDDSK